MDPHRHQGTRAIVTGAASGIGFATAARLVSEGAQVTACDVNEVGLAALAEVVASEQLTVLTADITNQHEVEAIVERAGSVDVLANVAGVMDGFVPLHDLLDDHWERVFAINVTAAMRLSRKVLPGMLEAKKGAIVNVASRAALLGGVAGTAYVASKHAVLGLTRSTASLYGRSGVRCNAVCPGAVETGIGASSIPSDPEYLAAWMPLLGAATPMAQPDEIAAVISWLASDEASNVNGAVVTADGGWSAQ